MEIVPKKHRAKINSIQTIAWGLFWNFSAVIGGYLVGDVEPYNFRLNFIVTACIYVVGVTLLVFLFFKPRKMKKHVQ
jgi:MFS family permease